MNTETDKKYKFPSISTIEQSILMEISYFCSRNNPTDNHRF